MKIQNYSICIEDLLNAKNQGHVAITTAKNGKTYANISIVELSEPDKYGNDFSVQLYDKNEKRAVFIGNGKKYRKQN